ncbi:MAG TPA: hypothetical protein VF043_27885 [Ktedonobacteraceae bacterium]
MDSSRFDELTKALATPTSRHQALRRIGGALTGAILASQVAAGAEAVLALAGGRKDPARAAVS